MAQLAKTLISKSSIVPADVKTYYQKSSLTTIISRCQRCVKDRIHVVEPEKQQAESPKLVSQVASQLDSSGSSDEPDWNMKLATKQTPEERKNSKRQEKRKRKNKDQTNEVNGEDTSNDEPRPKKTKDKLQRDALEKHSLMCDAALSTMDKMKGLLDKIKDKV